MIHVGTSNIGDFCKYGLYLDHWSELILSRDVPLLSPKDVNYFPTKDEIGRIRDWMKFKIGQLIAEHHPAFTGCGKFIK